MLRTEGRREVNVKVGLTMELDVPAVNVSEGGFCLMVSHRLPLRADVNLSFQLPGSDKPVECRGRVIWCSKSQFAPDNWDAGVKFINLPAEQQEIIRDFIKRETAAAAV